MCLCVCSGGHGRTGQVTVHLTAALYGMERSPAMKYVIAAHHGRPKCRSRKCDHIPETPDQVAQIDKLVSMTSKEHVLAMLELESRATV